jgi:hypothetical protein
MQPPRCVFKMAFRDKFNTLWILVYNLYQLQMQCIYFYSVPKLCPFLCRIQLHNETRTKQIAAWRNLVLDYHRLTKQCLLDIREAQRTSLFNNTAIDSILFVYLACTLGKNLQKQILKEKCSVILVTSVVNERVLAVYLFWWIVNNTIQNFGLLMKLILFMYLFVYSSRRSSYIWYRLCRKNNRLPFMQHE